MLVEGQLAVRWVQLGEGGSGDWDPDDPEDEELLRFDSLWRNPNGAWEDLECGSYCTRTPVNTPPGVRRQLLHKLMDFLRDAVRYYGDELTPDLDRHRMEEASWIEPSWADGPVLN